MLEATQRQLFEGSPGADGYEITGFKPYQPYSTDPTQYFAGPSSLQQSTYNQAGQMQTPGQFSAATGLAGAAGLGALGTQGQAQGLMGSALGYGQAGAGFGQAGQLYGAQGAQQANMAAQQAQRAAQMYGSQGSMYGAQAAGLAPAAQMYGQGAANIGMQGLGYGAQGAGFGQQAANMAGMGFGAGQQYAQQVTDPNAVGAYMSPYQQQVTDIAKMNAVREAQMAGQQANLGAARQGTYGGARQALMGAEREKNLLANLSNIQAQGSQSAFDRAIASQQFGANLGLQGLGAGYQGLGMGMQGAQTGLSGLGTAMQGQQAGLSGLGQAGSLYGQGMQGAGVGLSGVGQQLGAGQLGLQGTAQGIQGAQAGMQGAGVGLSGVGQALGAGQYGLQGLGQATQAASTLGQLGGAEQQADLARINLQNQLGSQQQQYQQGIINQQIQDYATAQQYPMMQLGFMSNMLRGLPMQATTTQSYQAQPNLATQAISGLGTAAGAYKAFGMKEGGSVKGLAVGGMGDRTGAAQQSESAQGIKAQLMAMPTDQVAQVAQTSPSETVRAMANEVLMEKRMQQQAEQQAEASIAQDQGMNRGLASAPAPSMDAIGAASGGIVAFADEGQVEEDDEYIARVQRMREKAGVTGSPVDPKLKGMYEERIAGLGGRRESDTGLNMIDFFSRMNKPGSTLSAGIAAAGEALPGITARRKDLMAEELAATKGMSDLTLAERAEQLGITKEAMALREKELDREKALKVANIGARERPTDLDKTTAAELALLLEQGAPNNAATRAMARTIAIEKTGLAREKVDVQQDAALTNRLKNDPQMKSLRTELLMADEKDKPEIQAKLQKREAELRGDIKKSSAASSDTSSGRFPKPDIAKVPNVPEGSSIGAQTNKGWEVKNKDGKVIGHIQK
jgi:hypothetical protein